MKLIPTPPPEGKSLLDYLVWIYPLTNDTLFQLIQVLTNNSHICKINEREDDEDNLMIVRKKICQSAVRELENIRKNQDCLIKSQYIAFLYGILSLNHLIIRNYQDLDREYLHALLIECLSIFLLAKNEDFLKLNEMKVIFELKAAE